MFFKTGFLLIAIASGLASAYNYGENQAGYNVDQSQQQVIRTGSFLNNNNIKQSNEKSNDKWTSGFNAQSPDSQDGSYIIRPQLRSNTLQRTINFRSAEQQSNLRPANGGNVLPNAGYVTGDLAANERSNHQRLLLPGVSGGVSGVSGLPKSGGSVSGKDVSPISAATATTASKSNEAQVRR